MQSSYLGGLSTADSDYRVNETRQFARMLGLKSKNTAVRSPVSNGIAESFMKTIKRDYISIMPKLVVCFLWSSLCSVLRKNILEPVEQMNGKRKLTAVCSHQTRIGNLDAHLI